MSGKLLQDTQEKVTVTLETSVDHKITVTVDRLENVLKSIKI